MLVILHTASRTARSDGPEPHQRAKGAGDGAPIGGAGPLGTLSGQGDAGCDIVEH